MWRWDQQEPFGADTPNGDPGSTGTTFDLPLRLPGQYADKETGLSYNYYRDYDPGAGRYVQSDPIGLRGGVDTYWYAYGNPLRYRDSDGRDPLIVIGAVIGGIAGAVQAANAGGGWTQENALNIVSSAVLGAGVGALAGAVPTEVGALATLVTGALAGGGGNLAGQTTSWAIERLQNPNSCAPLRIDWQQAGVQAVLSGSATLLGFAAGFGYSLSLVNAGGSSVAALETGALANAWTSGAAQIVGNDLIPTSSGGFQRR